VLRRATAVLRQGVVNMASSWSTRELQLVPLMGLVESSLTVMQLAELDLKRVDPGWPAEQAHRWMRKNGFDAAPLDEPEPHRFVGASWLEPNGDPVAGQARPINATLLVASDLGLADGVSRLKEYPYYFVLRRDNLQGIVTRADLQRPAVGMVLFSLILTSESAANVIIDRYLGPAWIEYLPGEQRERVNDIFNQRLRTNTEVTSLECLMLHDRLRLLGKCDRAVSALGFTSGVQFKKWRERLVNLRDNLAHGGGLLHAQSDPILAIELFEDVRSFAERIWGLVLSACPTVHAIAGGW
jgi:hypothetical protein